MGRLAWNWTHYYSYRKVKDDQIWDNLAKYEVILIADIAALTQIIINAYEMLFSKQKTLNFDNVKIYSVDGI